MKKIPYHRFSAKPAHRLSAESVFTHQCNPFVMSLPIVNTGARHFVESHFVGTTFGRIRLLVDVTFRRVRHSVEKNIQVRHFVEMVTWSTQLFYNKPLKKSIYLNDAVISQHCLTSSRSLTHTYLGTIE